MKINPTLKLQPPSGKKGWIIRWRDSDDGEIRTEPATEEYLLALKIISEDMTPEEAAGQANVPVGVIDRAIFHAVEKGIVIAPPSLIKRDASRVPKGVSDAFVTAHVFTLQWHVTNACDLSCRHCYDRTKHSPLTLKQGGDILNGLRNFCKAKHVRGNVCFTGGNPFLHPSFFEFYQSAAHLGFTTSILGNPVDRVCLERILNIQTPNYFQVSLEGLPEHNDEMRGKGFYLRVIEFLGLLRDLKIPSAVMLTLTEDNIDQVLPLSERLRGHAENFTFNRLSCVGEGVNLRLPPKKKFVKFLNQWVDAAGTSPILTCKDNLINIVLHQRGRELFDGCTGFGCGAAFNFLAVLPDGEVHACRKFPSRIGNIFEKSLVEIYDSELAKRYRGGSSACEYCELRHACGGCLSSSYAQGLDIFKERDPFCFKGVKEAKR